MLYLRKLPWVALVSVLLGPLMLHAEDPQPIGNKMFRVAWLQDQAGSDATVQPETIQPETSLEPEADLLQSTRTQLTSVRSSEDSLFDVSLPDLDFGSAAVTKEVVREQLPAERVSVAGGAISGPSNVVLGFESTVRATTDAGDLLESSLSNTATYNRQESPIVNQTRIRGYRYDQIRVTNSGAAWFPIRPDFDTPLSRFDSSIVRDVITVKGPYAVRNGPGFSFIDIALEDTPRYDCPQWGGHAKLLYHGNGEQWYARKSFHGGSQFSGWRIGYGHSGGVDYEAGDGSLIGASYKARDIDFAYGFDITSNTSLEFNYIRNDLTDVQLAGQVNDFEYLKSDGFSLLYTMEDQDRFDRLTIHSWYNASSFAGSDRNKAPSGGNFPGGLSNLNEFFVSPADPNISGLISLVTVGENSSKGVRSAMSWFGENDDQFTLGWDYLDVNQDYRHGFTGPTRITAEDATNPRYIENGGPVNFGVPLASQQDFGLFADSTVGLGEFVTLRGGTRLDFVDSTATRVVTPRPVDPLLSDSVIDPGPSPDQSFTLAAAYLTSEFILSRTWSADLGVGYAERAPSPTELYAERTFLNVIQQGGYFAPIGNNFLEKEKLVQIDLGVTGDYDFLQLGARAYHGWIDDFITARPTIDPTATPATIDRYLDPVFANTQARTWGAESYASLAITDQISAFGVFSYTGGRDDTISTPLWGIAPLETVLGVRWEGAKCRNEPVPWGVEYSVRMVDAQDRINFGRDIAVLPRGAYDPERTTPAFTLHHVRGYYRLNRALSLVAGIENIGDALYREHLNSITDLSGGRRATRAGVLDGGVLGRGRNIYIGIQSRY